MPDPGDARLRRTDFALLSVAIGVALLWVAPYYWPDGNHAQEVPPIMAMLHPGSFARDFAVQSFLGPTPRWAYQWLVVALATIGLPLAAAYFTLQLATLVAAAGAVLRIGESVVARRSAVAGAGIAIVLAFWVAAANDVGWTAGILESGHAIPSTFAMGLVLWGWAAAIDRRWNAAYALFGAAAVLQFLVGFLPGLLLLPLLLWEERSRVVRTAAAGIAVWGGCLLLVWLPIYLHSRAEPAVAGAEIVRIFGRVRAPNHWMPSSAGARHWVNQGLVAAAGIVIALLTPRTGIAARLRAIALTTIVGTVILLCANHVFVERASVALIGKLQFQRAMPFALLSILTVMAWHLDAALIGRRYALCVALLLAPLSTMHGAALACCAGGLGVTKLARVTRRAASVAIVDAIVLLGVVVAGGLRVPANFVDASHRLPLAMVVLACAIGVRSLAAPRRVRAVLIAGALIVASVTGFVLYLNEHPVRSSLLAHLARQGPAVESSAEISAEARAVSTMVHDDVPADALLLAPPVAALGFLPMLSERSVVLSWKNIPYSDAAIAEWGRRADSLLGVRHVSAPTDRQIAGEWRSRPGPDLAVIARTYGAGYLLSRDEWHPNVPGTRMSSVAGWTLWRLP